MTVKHLLEHKGRNLWTIDQDATVWEYLWLWWQKIHVLLAKHTSVIALPRLRHGLKATMRGG
jgi:hypothetical protein